MNFNILASVLSFRVDGTFHILNMTGIPELMALGNGKALSLSSGATLDLLLPLMFLDLNPPLKYPTSYNQLLLVHIHMEKEDDGG